MSGDDAILREYLRQTHVAATDLVMRRFPIEPLRIFHLFSLELADAWLAAISQLQSAGLSIREIGQLVTGPTTFTRLIPPIVHLGLKNAARSNAEIREAILLFLSLAAGAKWGDPLNADGKNEVLSPNEADQLAQRMRFMDADHQDVTAVRGLAGLLRGYVEVLFFAHPEIAMEVHGPYPVLGESTLLVRRFERLRPTEIWPASDGYPFSSVTVLSRYDGTLDLRMNYLGNMVSGLGELKPDPTGYAVLGDGVPLDSGQIADASASTARQMTAVLRSIEQTEMRGLLRQYMNILWYARKPLADGLSAEWRPPATLVDRVLSGEIRPEYAAPITLEMARDVFSLELDDKTSKGDHL